MEKINQNIVETDQNCQFCTRNFKSEQGLNYHMQKIHPLDLTSGLSCYTCNKTFTKRDLIENHFKTVKHQLECKKLLEEEKREQNCQTYRKLLMKMDNFKTRPISMKTWDLNRKQPLNIPLESTSNLEDPRLHRRKRQAILDPRPEKSRKLNSEDLSEKQPDSAEKDQCKPFEDSSRNSCENLSKQDIPKPIKEDRPRREEIYSENCIAAKPSSEGRSTLISSKIPNSFKTFQDPTKIPENPELAQMDGIPSKSDEIQSTFQDPIEESEDKPNSNPGTRSTLKQLPHEDPQDLVEIYLPTSEEDTIDQDLDRFIKEYLETNLKETKTVKLNNEWRITDSIGTPDFPELLKEDPNFDLLTFITEKMPF